MKAPCLFQKDDQQIGQVFCDYFFQIEKLSPRRQREAYKTEEANEP